MNFRIISLALALILFSGIAVATESSDFEKITFEGVDFKIPDGFKESRDAEDFDELGSEGQTCFYINDYKGEIVITVISDWMGMSLEELEKENATKTSLNGHEGWNYSDSGLHYFAYVHGDKGVLVGVTNETRLYEIVC